MNYAILDIGSNTVKMSVFDRAKKLLGKYSQATALLSYVKDRKLSEDGIQKLTETVASYQTTASDQYNARVYAYATASLRGLDNSATVIDTVQNKTGVAIDLVSGDEEAALAFNGIKAASGINPYGNTVFDLGGGSLEIAVNRNQGFYTQSYPVGALAIYLAFVKNILPTEEELRAIYAHVQSLTDPQTPRRHGKALAIGGTLRALCHILALEKNERYSEAYPYTVTRDEAIDFLARISRCDQALKLSLIAVTPKRIHTLAAGVTAFLALLDITEQNEFTVVCGGTRDGYLNKILSE